MPRELSGSKNRQQMFRRQTQKHHLKKPTFVVHKPAFTRRHELVTRPFVCVLPFVCAWIGTLQG